MENAQDPRAALHAAVSDCDLALRHISRVEAATVKAAAAHLDVVEPGLEALKAQAMTDDGALQSYRAGLVERGRLQRVSAGRGSDAADA